MPWKSQHPLQLAGLQVGWTEHSCPWQLAPNEEQFVHWFPPKPQELESVPGTQASPRQHPGQFWGPQLTGPPTH